MLEVVHTALFTNTSRDLLFKFTNDNKGRGLLWRLTNIVLHVMCRNVSTEQVWRTPYDVILVMASCNIVAHPLVQQPNNARILCAASSCISPRQLTLIPWNERRSCTRKRVLLIQQRIGLSKRNCQRVGLEVAHIGSVQFIMFRFAESA